MEQRTILFRGKKKDGGEWVEGSLIQLNSGLCYITANIHGMHLPLDGKLICEFTHQVDPKTVGQFTGKEDKNGKRVFEGDRMACKFERGPDKTGIIKFWKTHGGYVLVDDLNRNIGRLRSMWSYDTTIKELPEGGIDGEITGTIHDK